jgi:hypothetical protein
LDCIKQFDEFFDLISSMAQHFRHGFGFRSVPLGPDFNRI